MGRIRHTQRTKAAVLENFANCGRIDLACMKAGVERRSHYRWLKEDPAYGDAYIEAKELALQLLEDEAFRRAHAGVDEPIVYSGKILTREVETVDENGVKTIERVPVTIKRFSDTLMMFLLKAQAPEKYRERLDHKHTGEVTVVNLVKDILEDAAAAQKDE